MAGVVSTRSLSGSPSALPGWKGGGLWTDEEADAGGGNRVPGGAVVLGGPGRRWRT